MSLNPFNFLIPLFSGYDVFISYRWKDAKTYTKNLADQLEAKGLKCFVDYKGMTKGDLITDSLRRAIRKSTMLVLVVTDSVAISTWIAQELEAFPSQKRKIIPINVDGALDRLPLGKSPWAALANRDRIEEQAKNILDGAPADHVPAEIDRALSVKRQAAVAAQKIFRLSLTIGAGVLILAAVTVYNVYRAKQQQDVAVYMSLRADEKTREAEEKTKEAREQAGIASRMTAEAKKQEELAARMTEESIKQRNMAIKQKEIATAQTITANRRLDELKMKELLESAASVEESIRRMSKTPNEYPGDVAYEKYLEDEYDGLRQKGLKNIREALAIARKWDKRKDIISIVHDNAYLFGPEDIGELIRVYDELVKMPGSKKDKYSLEAQVEVLKIIGYRYKALKDEAKSADYLRRAEELENLP